MEKIWLELPALRRWHFNPLLYPWFLVQWFMHTFGFIICIFHSVIINWMENADCIIVEFSLLKDMCINSDNKGAISDIIDLSFWIIDKCLEA